MHSSTNYMEFPLTRDSLALGGSIFLATRVRTAKVRAKYAAMRSSVGSTILLKPTNAPDGDTSYPDGTQKTFLTTTSNPFSGGTYRDSMLTIGSNPFAGGTMRSTMSGHSRNPSAANPEFTYAVPHSPTVAEHVDTEVVVKAQEAGTSYSGFNDPLGQEETQAPAAPVAANLVDVDDNRKIG